MKLPEKLARSMIGCALVVYLLAGLIQCSPPPPAPSRKGQRWGLAVHDNVTLLSAIGGSSEYPAWSPDGARIAFQHVDVRFGSYDSSAPRDIYLIKSDGTQEQPLTDVAEQGISCEYPSWAPGSQCVVCSCKADHEYDLCIIDVATRALTQLTDFPGDEIYPAWSPDGTHIAFSSNMDAKTKSSYSLYTVRDDGSALKRLTDGLRDRAPAWSPDSRSIAFSSSKSKSRGIRLCVVELDGSEPTCYDSAECVDIAWSPSTSQIACTSSEGIITIQIEDGITTTQLQTGNDFLSGLSWSPDGTQRVFTSGVMVFAAHDLYVLDVEP